MKLSLITVSHRSSAHLPGLLESLDMPIETIVVENSGEASELAELRALKIDRLIEAPNRGYGAGLNRGIAESSGDLLVLCNPDLAFRPGAIATMIELVSKSGVGAVAPQQLWDSEGRWFLPQPQTHDFGDELARILAPGRWAQRELEWQLELWSAAEPKALSVLSGACLVIERTTFEVLGGFDERFFLYFEENDLCRRMWRRGLRTVFEPRAQVVHPFGHAIGASAGEHFGRSLDLYRELHLPWIWRKIRPSSPPPPNTGPERVSRPGGLEGEPMLVSYHPSFVPTAMRRLDPGEEPSVDLLPKHALGEFVFARLLRNGKLESLEGRLENPVGAQPAS